MLELEAALSRILAALPSPESELIPLADAHNRVLLDPVSASVDLPGFDNSAMDGFAVRVADVAGATADTPARLQLVGRVTAGETFEGEVGAGQCVRLFTGSLLPRGADAVVMQEDTRTNSAAPAEVLVQDAVKPGENVRRRGGDVARGAQLVGAGQRLGAGHLALLAAAGVSKVNVGKQPRVGLLATGSELREAGESLATGQIYESNRVALSAMASQAGARPQLLPIVRDSLEATRAAFERSFGTCDILITSGGASVGETDFVKAALTELGGELDFWKVAIKPGKPFVFGRCRGKFLFGLPGNPVSAFVTFLLLVRPALLRWQGAANVALPSHAGVLAEPLANPGSRRHFMRVRVDASGKVFSTGLQASHALASLAVGDGLVDVPPQTTFVPGASVVVARYR